MDELKRMARGYMRRERPDHTLQTTALVHEAYLKLVRQR
jgi:RNA polymerase sigma-70 factor (ECF subfamily)